MEDQYRSHLSPTLQNTSSFNFSHSFTNALFLAYRLSHTYPLTKFPLLPSLYLSPWLKSVKPKKHSFPLVKTITFYLLVSAGKRYVLREDADRFGPTLATFSAYSG